MSHYYNLETTARQIGLMPVGEELNESIVSDRNLQDYIKGYQHADTVKRSMMRQQLTHDYKPMHSFPVSAASSFSPSTCPLHIRNQLGHHIRVYSHPYLGTVYGVSHMATDGGIYFYDTEGNKINETTFMWKPNVQVPPSSGNRLETELTYLGTCD